LELRPMIKDEQQFEAALAEACGWLREPAGEAEAEQERFLTLLHQIARYRPNIFAPANGVEATQRDRLLRHLEEFEARVTRRYGRHWSALVGGDLRTG